jgi:hypothetical protein
LLPLEHSRASSRATRVRLHFRGKLWMNPLFEKPG